MPIKCPKCLVKARTNYFFGKKSKSRTKIEHKEWCSNVERR